MLAESVNKLITHLIKILIIREKIAQCNYGSVENRKHLCIAIFFRY